MCYIQLVLYKETCMIDRPMAMFALLELTLDVSSFNCPSKMFCDDGPEMDMGCVHPWVPLNETTVVFSLHFMFVIVL